jgi:hypothetical protein
MTVHLCEYCRHALTAEAAECLHCGARRSPHSSASSEPGSPHGTHKLVPEVSPAALEHHAEGLAGHVAELLARPPRWVISVAGLVLVVVVAIIVLCHPFHLRPLAPGTGPTGLLPASLRVAASCAPYDAAKHTDRCVIPADNPLLMDIGGGRDFDFYIQEMAHAQLSTVIRQWQADGGTVVADDAVFVAISPARSILYADPQTGLRIDTDTFSDSQSAQAFLSRTGLAG